VVSRVDLPQVDWWSTAAQITVLEREKATLEGSSAELLSIASDLEHVQREIADRERAFNALHARRGSVDERLSGVEHLLAGLSAAHQLVEQLEPQARDLASTRLGDPDSPAECDRAVSAGLEAVADQQRRLTERRGERAGRAGRLMTAFRRDFPAKTTEVDDDIRSADEYRELARRLAGDDLPRFEADFKRALNKETINELATFNAQLRKHQATIRGRVDRINESLQGIDYNTAEGTYIALVAEDTPNNEVRDFRRDLKECTSDVVGVDDDQYSERKFLQVRQLISRLAGRQGYTDAGNWFVFSGSERYRATDEEREAFADSDGKSGGQKEKLAYTILAASLAYQFKLDPSVAEQRSFRFAVIDEASDGGRIPPPGTPSNCSPRSGFSCWSSPRCRRFT
jgi:uncharacterized protein YPO0396